MPSLEERLTKLESDLEGVKRFADLDTRVTVLEKSRHDNNLVILGETLKIPMGPWLIVLALVVLIFLTFFLWEAPESRVSQILVLVFHRNEAGQLVRDTSPEKEASAIYTLITPHEKTLEDLEQANPPLTDEEKRYYKLDPGALEGFARQIMEEGAQGYSRREVWGQGRRALKRGWEWTITWRSDHKISVQRLVEIYHKYFHRSEDIYIEEKTIGPTLRTAKR